MFYGCTSLVDISDKPFFKFNSVTSISNSACRAMFYGCIKLTNVNKYSFGYLATQSGCTLGPSSYY